MVSFDLKVFTLSAPAISALVAMMVIFYDVFAEGRNHRRLKIKLMLYYGCTIISSISIFLYFFYPGAFLWINSLYIFSLMAMPMFLYAFIFKITKTGIDERFSKAHYIAPILLAISLLIISILTPANEQLLTVKGNGSYNGGSRLFFYASNGKLILRLAFSAIYITLIFKRLPRYRAYIHSYSSNESKSSLRWVPIYLIFMLGTFPLPFLAQFIARDALMGSGFAFIQVALLVTQHSFLAYHVVKGNYILQEKAPNVEIPPAPAGDKEKKTNTPLKKSKLTRSQFEKYLQTTRPYLKADLKITDLVSDLQINRTYISAFINSEYGMNFSNYINLLRLKEFNRLREHPSTKDKSTAELSEMAGFGSCRNYYRAQDILKE